MSFSAAPEANSETFGNPDQFVRRHIGPNAAETAAMLKVVGFDSLDALMAAAVPQSIRLPQPLQRQRLPG